MIDLYFWPTPNGWKVSIMLEECGLDYTVQRVDIGRGAQFAPAFAALSPNHRIPALVDHAAAGVGHGDGSGNDTPLSIFESGAILVYLAEKTGRFLPTGARERFDVLQWLFWQVGGLGPMAGQLGHFVHAAKETSAYAVERYRTEHHRLLGVLDRRLADREFIAGEYSIADIASWPWVRSAAGVQQSLDEFVHLQRWFEIVAARPAVRRGAAVGADWWASRRPPADVPATHEGD